MMYKRFSHRDGWMKTRKRWHIIREMTLLHLDVRNSAGSSVLKEEVHQWATSFPRLMKSDLGQQIFTRFLEEEYSDENMLFWHACEDFKREVRSVKREIMAKEIFATFLANSAPLEVNVDWNGRADLVKKMTENPSKDVFNDAQEQVYRLMERDCFPRFVRSNVYTGFVKNIERGERPQSRNMFEF